MNRKAHIAIGVVTTAIAGALLDIKCPGIMQYLTNNIEVSFNIGAKTITSGDASVMFDNAIIAIIASPIPDIDLKIPGMGHRTWTHGFLIMIISSLFIGLLNKQMGIIWGIAYLSHLLADSLTKMGVPFFYPFSKKKYGLRIL